EDARGDFSGEIVLRREVAVEAAVRQAGALHDVGEADPIVPALTKKRSRDVENLLAIGLRLLACHSHDASPARIRLTLYLMHVINTIHDDYHETLRLDGGRRAGRRCGDRASRRRPREGGDEACGRTAAGGQRHPSLR